MLAKLTIADYMTKHVFTLKKNTGVLEAIKSLLSHKVTCAPVVDEHGRLLGMFSEKDSMKVVLETAYNRGLSGTVGEFMSTDIITVAADDSIVDLAERFRESTVRSFPVFNDGKLVGVVSRTDVLKALTSM
jgi:CBS domain-containing protein